MYIMHIIRVKRSWRCPSARAVNIVTYALIFIARGQHIAAPRGSGKIDDAQL